MKTPVKTQVQYVLGSKTGLRVRREYDRIDTARLESCLIMLDYLTRFPFLGKRQITVE